MKASTRRSAVSVVILSLVAVVAVGWANNARAATLYWDTNDITAGFGTAAGTWGTDSWWTTDSSGLFADTPGTATTTSTDNVVLNKGNITGFTMAVAGDVYANSLTYQSNAGSANNGTVTNGGSGVIHLYGSGLGNPFFTDAGGTDIRLFRILRR